MVFPAKPETSRALIEALGSQGSTAKHIIQAEDVFEGFYSVAAKWRICYSLAPDLKNENIAVGTLLSDARKGKFYAEADPALVKKVSRESWRFVYQPGQRPDWKNNDQGLWESTGEFNFVINKCVFAMHV